MEKMTNGEGFITERSKYLPVILERSEESRHRLEILNVFLCRILRSLWQPIFSPVIIPILSTAQEWRQGCFWFFYDILPCVLKLAPIASQARHFPRQRGQRTNKEERIHSFIILYTLLTIFLAGFFAKSQIMFFLPSSFRYFPPLKNDGRGEMRFLKIFTWFLWKNGRMETVCRPRTRGRWRRSRRKGQVWAEAKNLGISVSKAERTILTCAFKLAPIASQARHFPPISGEADTKEERIHIFKMYYLIVAIKR